MGNFFKFANRKEVTHIDHPEFEGEWVEVQAEFSKADVKKILKIAPKNREDLDGVLGWQEQLFEMVVKAWSFNDDDGKMVPITATTYNKLDIEVSSWIDEIINDTLNPVLNKDGEEEKKLES